MKKVFYNLFFFEDIKMNDEIIDPTIINDIQELGGVGKKTAISLINGGYISISQIAATKATILSQNTGLAITTASKIIEKARIEVTKSEFLTGSEVLAKERTLKKITTGVIALDKLLGGGVETGSTLEIAGEFRTGKTQIAHQLCITTQLPPDKGGLEGKTLYLDCEGTFSAKRMLQIIDHFNLDQKKALDNILHIRIYDSEHLLTVLDTVPEIIDNNNVKLLIIDSIIVHFRSEYIGRETLSERQGMLSKTLNKIIKICDKKLIAVVYTNQVLSDPSAMWKTKKPTGGNIMAHAAKFRVQLRKGRGNARIAKLIDCSFLPEVDAAFKITENGVEDIKENQKIIS